MEEPARRKGNPAVGALFGTVIKMMEASFSDVPCDVPVDTDRFGESPAGHVAAIGHCAVSTYDL
jgi:hypothetical protein